MSQFNSLPLSVCWHEGMLLSPQHFQQNHIYWESQLQSLIQAMPYRWGIMQMAIDEARLLEGVVYLTRLRAIMPDGLQIDYDVREHAPLQIDLNKDAQFDEQAELKIQLTVPIRVSGSASNSSDIQRFHVVDGELAKDDNTGEEEAEVLRLQPIIALQATNQVKQQYIALPLLQVSKIDGAQYQITAYCPPMLGIGADNFIASQDAQMERLPLQPRLQNMAFMIRKKARLLAGFSEDGEELLGSRVSEQHRLWIRAMVQHLAELELLVDSAVSPPWQVYQVLARLIGSLCELDSSRIPPKLPSYQHQDCGSGLGFAIRYIEQRLEQVNLRYSSLAFEEGQDGIFTMTFDKAWSRNELLIELKPRANQTQSELVQWLQNCRIASMKMHKELSTKRLLGASVEQVEYDEITGVTALPGHALFYIKIDPAFIKAGQPLVLACTSGKLKAMQPKRIVLHLPHEADMK
ncbi:type VI secretion system baseplate subunit TssK [Marinomonas transparens]|uniref:Type VI secretion system baseplate subunit TssK n=1 Tax=Marinomonas transparens TaxID=2795388 RepID=A0A934JZJ9_9GAMM|nr:type VI secretion system baseplate subunit TssK [Marinomonas transparens]MBJ7540004.1 type VI secretion system baseplate subunit TssK [Marinomonas transparens]